MTENKTQTQMEIQLCCKALEDKKAIDLKILDVRGKSSITDYFIIATGSSQPHLKAMRDGVKRVFKDNNVKVLGADSAVDSGWVAIDVFDFIIHLFNEETRDIYSLEALWKDAEILSSENFEG